MHFDSDQVLHLLKTFNFKSLFIKELGWDHHSDTIETVVNGQAYKLAAIAQKRGVVVFLHEGTIPDDQIRRKIDRAVAKSAHQHLIIFSDTGKAEQVWQWVRREPGKPLVFRQHTFHSSQSGESLIQRLKAIAFSLEEEEQLHHVEVTGRVRAAFDTERVTKRFYDRFKSEHEKFLNFIKGIPDDGLQHWYAAVMLNRLMFIYFVQKKEFLDNDIDYLRTKLGQSKQRGKDRFYADFLCPLFFDGFAKKESERSTATNELLGKVPYLNGGLFLRHQVEEARGTTIRIADVAFEKLFAFFEEFHWHLDERPNRNDREINPDVLGYIFEKYINQKQMGAYYTKEDITGYISQNTVIPFLFDAARQKCKIAFEGNQSVWCLLQLDPDRYIYEPVKRGVIDEKGEVIPESALPEFVRRGMHDPKARMFEKRYNLGEADLRDATGKKLTLPTETWREYVERRKRCLMLRERLAAGEIRTINELITYNLNIRQFAQDVIENSEGPELLRAFYHAIEKVTVLDPTCGSGAFLFAALNILEPLYEACLDRMEVFVDELARSGAKHRPEKFSDFRNILDRVASHPNRRYFILKSIILNNLYGVDIMEEAVEICKLRLFLKLVAQVERVEQIEPLPDIDFNVRAGNTLVGYATYDAVKQAVQSKLDFENVMARIEEKAQDVDRLFGLFRQQQTELSGMVTAADKQKLRKRLKVLEEELNRYLAHEYQVNPNSETAYLKWHDSHKPFHWFIEFYGIMKKGGFDVIIGNPPFIENTPSKVHYALQPHNYRTFDCGNLYAFVAERCCGLCNKVGSFSFVMPAASICTPRMGPLEAAIQQRYETHWTSVWDERPSKLFDGVDQQLTIHIGRGRGPLKQAWVTAMRHWTAEERQHLFETMSFLGLVRNDRLVGVFPKVGVPEEKRLLTKIRCVPHVISGCLMLPEGGVKVFYRNAGGRYWRLVKGFPTVFHSSTGATVSSTEKTFNVEKKHFMLCVGLFSSSFFYWFWRVCSNCRHLTDRELKMFPIAKSILEEKQATELSCLAARFEARLKDTKQRQTIENKRSGTVVQDVYFVNRAKDIIDEIDRVLAKHYGFTDEELDFIINYDIKYRMGQDAGSEDS